MIYLLSTQSLLDLLTGHPPMEAWMKDKPARSVEISTVSVGQVTQIIHGETDAASRKELEVAFVKLLLAFRAYNGIVPFDEATAKVWGTLLSKPLKFDSSNELSAESRMVVAVALARNATLVDAKRPYQSAIKSLLVSHP